ncbi:MAG: hypothetical protein HY904_03990 [Deltaproteobacteria bacterium]|nr:hypothetical protein [Deltaproteobacteria bacterium]
MITAAVLAGLVAGHMFSGLRTVSAQALQASVTVAAVVRTVSPGAEGAVVVDLEVTHVPCGHGAAPGPLRIHQLAEHGTAYQPGQRALFPLLPARRSPHRPADLPPDAWTVDQAPSEVTWLTEAELAPAVDRLARFCRAPPAARQAVRVEMLVEGPAGLARAAALDLALAAEPLQLEGPVEARLADWLRTRSVPAGLRVAGLQAVGRAGPGALRDAAADLLRPWEPPEVVAAALRALGPDDAMARAALPALLMGPPGLGRMHAARLAGAARLEDAVPALGVLAWGPETEAAGTACRALAAVDSRAARAELERLRGALPPERARACARGAVPPK